MTGKVHRSGFAVQAKRANKRHGRNCRSAPTTPTGVTLSFHRRELARKRERWRATARWDPVDEDVAGRALNIELFQAQLRATDASGDPVETQGQAESSNATGAEFNVHAGSAPAHFYTRELNASPDEVKKTLTGLTTGIAAQVNFFAYGAKKWNVTGVASTDVITTSGNDHGYTAGDQVEFTSLGGAAGLSNGTTYFVIASGLGVRTFKVSTTSGGSAVNFTTDITTGTVHVVKQPRLRFSVYNVTDTAEVVAKNETMTGPNPKLYVTRTFTPAAGKTYEARVSFVSGSGTGFFSHANWHDLGNAAQWSQMVPSDEDPFAAGFLDIPRPKVWFYATRVRAMNRHAGHRCWSAWSEWTTPKNPFSGMLAVGPPAPTGVTLVLDKVEGARRSTWRAKVKWNETPWWFPPDDDPVEGADLYHVQLAVSNNGGTTTSNIRNQTVRADDTDGNQTANANFAWKILGRRHYRARVKAVQEGRAGAWSAWTAWASPGGVPDPPTGVTWSNPTPRLLVAKWTEPVDKTDVDRYRVRVFRQPGSVLVDDGFTDSTRWVYHIPKVDRDNAHKVRVNSVEDPGSLDVDEDVPTGWDAVVESSDVESSDLADTAPIISDIHNANDDPVITALSGFHKCHITYANNGALTEATRTFIRFGTEIRDTASFHQATTDALTATDPPGGAYDLAVPFNGDYQIFVGTEYPFNSAGRRVIGVNIDNVLFDSYSTPAHPTANMRFSPGPFYIPNLTAGDTLQVWTMAATGSGSNLVDAKCTIIYWGAA